MKYYFRTSNDDYFLSEKCLREQHAIDWQQTKQHYEIGDVIFLYLSTPVKQIRFMLIVEDIDFPYRNTINKKCYWGKKHTPENAIDYDALTCRLKLLKEVNSQGLHFKELAKHGLNRLYPHELKGEILDYILSFFTETPPSYFDELNCLDDIFEGAKESIVVNRYERDRTAVEKCKQINGCRCAVCGMDFEETYGQLGHGFIHVHHIVPIATIGKEYKLDPVNDLVPVCPNCHAMLHHGAEGRVLTIEELKEIIKK